LNQNSEPQTFGRKTAQEAQNQTSDCFAALVPFCGRPEWYRAPT
jgi:hypothetical protein